MAIRVASKATVRGAAFLAVATVLYGLYGVYSRYIGEDFGSFFTIWVRAVDMLIVLAVIILASKQWKSVAKEDIKWFAAMTLPGFAAIVSIFVAFNHLPVGTVHFSVYASSTLVGYLIGMLLFKERVNSVKLLSLVVCLVGLLIIFSETMKAGQVLYIVLAIVAGSGNAAWNIISKKVSSKYSPTQVLTIDSLLTVIMALPFAVILGEHMSIPSFDTSWIIVVIFALTAIVSSLLTIGGFKIMEAQKGSLIMLLVPVFSTVFGFLFFGEAISPLFLLGSALIMVGMALPVLREATQ